MSTESLAGAIVGHLVGDYLLQNDWMALHKKEKLWRCAIHVVLWYFAVLTFSGWGFTEVRHGFLLGQFLVVTHFLQDHTDIVRRWMGWIGQEKFATGPCSPWSIIVVDNVWHIVAIWVAWKWLV